MMTHKVQYLKGKHTLKETSRGKNTPQVIPANAQKYQLWMQYRLTDEAVIIAHWSRIIKMSWFIIREHVHLPTISSYIQWNDLIHCPLSFAWICWLCLLSPFNMCPDSCLRIYSALAKLSPCCYQTPNTLHRRQKNAPHHPIVSLNSLGQAWEALAEKKKSKVDLSNLMQVSASKGQG